MNFGVMNFGVINFGVNFEVNLEVNFGDMNFDEI